jgi:hypothetical protein
MDANDWGWWEHANDRRQTLIERKHMKDDLTPLEIQELDVLQDLAELIVDKFSPGRF